MHHSPVQLDPVSVVPPEIAPSEDLTARGRQVPESVEFVLCGEPQYAALFDRIARVLHRREQGNVLLVAERGVGAGALLGELARWGALGQSRKSEVGSRPEGATHPMGEENGAVRGAPPFLRGKRFVEVNCRYTVPEESRVRLLALLASVAGQEELVVCIDGFGSLLRSERGATNNGALLSALTSWHGGEMQSAE